MYEHLKCLCPATHPSSKTGRCNRRPKKNPKSMSGFPPDICGPCQMMGVIRVTQWNGIGWQTIDAYHKEES